MMCDAYAGCDQEYEINLNVAEGDDSSDDSSEAESGDEEKMEEWNPLKFSLAEILA